MRRYRALSDCLPKASWREHVYRPLNQQLRQIRILELFPSKNLEDDPEGVLHTVELGHADFAALSYVWGDPTDLCCMTLNGWRVRISRNAHTALRYIRQAHKAERVWLDAPCIDRANIDERNQQVPLMKDIYSLARPVFVWAGLQTADSHVALILIDDIAEIAIRAIDGPVGYTSQLEERVWKGMMKWIPSHRKLVREFLQIPLWTRVWIVQEILLSSKRWQSVLLVGMKRKSLRRFMLGLRTISRIPDVLQVPQSNYLSNSVEPNDIRRIVYAAQLVSMIHDDWMRFHDLPDSFIQRDTIRLQATDPKDYVYALTGLLPYLSSSIDYNKSLAEIYEEATFAILSRNNSLNLLLDISYHFRERDTGMPTWTVDWRDKKDQNFGLRWASIARNYNACGGIAPSLTRRGHQLGVQAHRLFCFAHDVLLGPSCEFTSYDTVILPSRQRQFAMALLGWESGHESTRFAIIEIFVRSLLLDMHIDDAEKRINYKCDVFDPASMQPVFDLLFPRLDSNGYLPEGTSFERLLKAYRELTLRLRHTRMAVSPQRHLCIVPVEARLGDEVWILAGSSVPVVLRPERSHPPSSVFRVVGGAYVHGVMDGEAIVDSAKRVSTGDPDAHDLAFEQLWLV